MSNWTLNGKDFTQDDVTEGMAGFVYKLYNHGTGQSYIGKKVFWSRRVLPPLKGSKRRRRVVKPSDWQKYWGSSEAVKKDLQHYPKQLWTREILSIHANRSELINTTMGTSKDVTMSPRFTVPNAMPTTYGALSKRTKKCKSFDCGWCYNKTVTKPTGCIGYNECQLYEGINE